MIPGKTTALTRWTFVGKVKYMLFNMVPRLVITFLSRSKSLLISWKKERWVLFGFRSLHHTHLPKGGVSGFKSLVDPLPSQERTGSNVPEPWPENYNSAWGSGWKHFWNGQVCAPSVGQKHERARPRGGRKPTEAGGRGHQGPARPQSGKYLEFILFLFYLKNLFFWPRPMAYGILVPWPGIEPMPPWHPWMHGVLTTGVPGKSPGIHLEAWKLWQGGWGLQPKLPEDENFQTTQSTPLRGSCCRSGKSILTSSCPPTELG